MVSRLATEANEEVYGARPPALYTEPQHAARTHYPFTQVVGSNGKSMFFTSGGNAAKFLDGGA